MDLGNCKELIDNWDDVIDVVVMAQEEYYLVSCHKCSPGFIHIRDMRFHI
jgi:hypothetical protein